MQLSRSISEISAAAIAERKEEQYYRYYPYKNWNITPTTEDLAYM